MSRGLRIVVTHDEADLRLLGLANEKGKFAIELGLVLEEELQFAFERGIDNEWFTLVDVSPGAAAPGRMLRFFRLTGAGRRRLLELQAAIPR